MSWKQMSDPASTSTSALDLSHLPPIFLSTTHFPSSTTSNAIHNLEQELLAAHACLTYSPGEAAIILSRATRKTRAKFDLRAAGLRTVDVPNDKEVIPVVLSRGLKRKRDNDSSEPGDDSSTETEGESATEDEGLGSRGGRERRSGETGHEIDLVRSGQQLVTVVKIDWFTNCSTASEVLPLDDYITYQGYKLTSSNDTEDQMPSSPIQPAMTEQSYQKVQVQSILARAKEDQDTHPSKPRHRHPTSQLPSNNSASWQPGNANQSQYTHLLRMTTTEHDGGTSSELPSPPAWVQRDLKYSCQRSTPRLNPNETFLSNLHAIKLARLLTGHEIGVRAYSTSIAAIAAYPYPLTSPREIIALPGCDAKIANLFVEWKNTGGQIHAVSELEANPDLQVLRLFYEIWGVGATTAREFYYDKGWRDLDDVVEFGWKTLSRVQQIGVKYYEEFLDRIPRSEVEEIAAVVHRHAVQVRDAGIQSMLVGGYRRGKETCGDVDIIISHPDEKQTLNLIVDLVASLENEDWITHTLLLSLHNTHRDQQTLPFRASKLAGAGFDSLDKALVVWQNPVWDNNSKTTLPLLPFTALPVPPPKPKNPNIHRRVDIIIAPWRTVGCAILGWTGGTTFERDLRRYAKNVKGWKFDSSGVRSRGNGEVLDLEGFLSADGGPGPARTMEEAERRVFEGLGIEWRRPGERCTG